ncbi:MAG TPA: carboxypeptidase regulatory-like domain-containing protein [Longimicrobium sp.]|uniref:TonB-dependent receptor n=1 Tax=Longimicrobium sp. TaxID=2029185 RepID=UPI002EDB9DF0
MNRASRCMVLLIAALAGLAAPDAAWAQVTTGSLSGTVTSSAGEPVAGASVTAVHQPSGTRYSGATRADGRFQLPGMRVGGPYTVTVARVGLGTQSRQGITVNLGSTTDLSFRMAEATLVLEEVTVQGQRAGAVFSPDRTGAATTVAREQIDAMPTVSRRIEDFARLTPQASGGLSFAGTDNRLNNITVDGSYFNNSFGLAGAPGQRTGVAPISLDAIEQVQVNVAPFDVRQGNFVGAGVNTVTRSGTNELHGALRFDFRDEGLVGDQAGATPFTPGQFDFRQFGAWLSGPIVKNRLFFFVNLERESLTEPGTTFRANTGAEAAEGSTTRVLESDLTALSSFLGSNFNYQTGPFQGYEHAVPGTRFLAKLDYNINDGNRLSLRYNHLDSEADVLLSNSSSLGFGTRRTNLSALNFQGSNYSIKENIRSLVGEWNSQFRGNWANNMILGYTFQDESRGTTGELFPFVDILNGGSVYTSFGTEPFTPNNELRYSSLQFQNNVTRFGTYHTQTFGISAERYESENVFFPGSQSVYVYNSLADFYADANGYLANPNRTTSPVTLRRFQVRWANIPGQEKPVQPLEVFYTGAYAQNEWRPNGRFTLTTGLRVDMPVFGNTAYANEAADLLTFRDENGQDVRYSTGKLPDPAPLFSPRLGFNWDVLGTRSTQVRGGTGVFTGRPAFVWISNQIGTTGVLTGFEQLDNTTARPFNPDPNTYKPKTVTGAPASSYELALTDPDFRFPQVWRTNLAVDQRLPLGLVATVEYLHGRDLNGVYYINANLAPANTAFTGPDTRPRWTAASGRCPTVSGGFNRLNCNVANAVVLKNGDEGRSWNLSASLERPFARGVFAKVAYSYGEAKNTVDAGSIAFGSWNNNPHAGDPNNPGLGFSANSPGHRVFAALSARRDLFGFGATTVSLFWEGRNGGNTSYVYGGDLNGDGGTSNDLLYVPRDASEMNFQQYTQTVGSGSTAKTFTYTAAQQAEAFEAFIQQDRYLREHRGEYVERNAVFLPMVYRMDFSVSQQLASRIGGRRHGLELRADVLNFANLLSSDYGTGFAFVTTQPVLPAGTNAAGQPQFRLRNINGELITETFTRTAATADVYRVQLGLRYLF